MFIVVLLLHGTPNSERTLRNMCDEKDKGHLKVYMIVDTYPKEHAPTVVVKPFFQLLLGC